MKNIILIICLLGCVGSVLAGENSLYIGVKGSSIFSFSKSSTFDNIVGEDINNYTPLNQTSKSLKIGYSTGVFAEFQFSKVVSVNGGIDFKSIKNYTTFYYNDTTSHSITLNQNSINIPIYFKFYVGKKVKFYGLAGWNFGINLNGKKQIGNLRYFDINDLSKPVAYKQKDLIATSQMAVMLGAGLQYDIKRVSIFTDFTSNLGLFRYFPTTYFEDQKQRYFDFGVNVGIKVSVL